MSVVLEYGALGLRRGKQAKKQMAAAWEYQIDAWNVFRPTIGNKECPNCRLYSPTGSGKSLVIKKVAMGWAALGRVVIIAVPKESIKSSFHGQQFLIDGEVQDWAKPMNFSKDYEPTLRDLGEVKALKKFLERPDADPDRRSWVCTHVALLAAFRDGADFSNAYVVVDEGHHIAAEGKNLDDVNIGGSLLQHMLANGIPHMLCTATPFRADRRAPTPRWAKHLYATYTRERADHIDDMRFVAGVNTRVEAGDVEDILNREFAKIKREKRKAIVSLPHVGGRFAVDYGRQLDGCSNKYRFEEHIFALAKKHRLKVVSIATPESDKANGEELDEILSRFREHPNDPQAYAALPDIVLVLERYKEGTDCSAWSTIIQIGLPGSPVEILQYQGRGTRDHKCKDGMLVEHLIIIPTPDPNNEKTFEHTLDTVKSLVVLAFLTTYQFEEMAQTMDEGDSPLDRIEEQLTAVAQGKATPEQRKILQVLGMVLPPQEPEDTVSGSVSAVWGQQESARGGEDRDNGNDSPTPEPLEPKPLQFLSKRFGLDVDAMSDDEVLKTIRQTCLSMGKAIYKGFARQYHARLARRSQESLQMEIITLYEQGHSLRRIVGKLRGHITEDEVHRHLQAAHRLRPADRYRVKSKVRRPRAPQRTLGQYLKRSIIRG